MASQKMNSKTHKIIIATYTNEYLYAVPIDWEVNDIKIKDGTLYYKQKEQDVPKEEYEPNYTYPNQIEDYEDGNLEYYFDCEEVEEEEEECDAHPPYRCDGGCGKKMGEGNDDECKRICGDCEEEEVYYM